MYADDAELTEALSAGNESAYRHAIRTFQPARVSLARSIAGYGIADEVVQEAWVSAMGAIDHFEGRASLKTWLLRIVANEAKTRLRKGNRSVSLEAISGDEDPFKRRFDDKGHWQPDARPGAWDDAPDELLSSRDQHGSAPHASLAPPDVQALPPFRPSAPGDDGRHP